MTVKCTDMAYHRHKMSSDGGPGRSESWVSLGHHLWSQEYMNHSSEKRPDKKEGNGKSLLHMPFSTSVLQQTSVSLVSPGSYDQA